ncbi:MAG: ATPase, T2SS/T4P/T4SS family, partial [Thermodesulfobacteriota bacterium]
MAVEGGSQAGGAQKATLQDLLKSMIEKGASDLHVSAGSPPRVRVRGKLSPMANVPVMSGTDTRQMTYSILTDIQKHAFEEENELDFSFGIKGLSRFRGNLFVQRGTVAGVFRAIPFEIKTFADLGLPPIVEELSNKPRGLVLVTGPTGSGKTTTLYSALADLNKTSENISTAEDPVEFNLMGINQVQMHEDIGLNFAAALRSFLRQDPDIIMV